MAILTLERPAPTQTDLYQAITAPRSAFDVFVGDAQQLKTQQLQLHNALAELSQDFITKQYPAYEDENNVNAPTKELTPLQRAMEHLSSVMKDSEPFNNIIVRNTSTTRRSRI